MSKKALTFVSIILVLIIVIGILLFLLGAKHGTVYVDGQLTRDIHVSRYKNGHGITIKIPLLAVLAHLDYGITQQDTNIFELKKNDETFVLDLERLSLQGDGHKGMNYLINPPGSTQYYCLREGNDIILDMNTLDVVLWLMEDECSVWGIPALKIVFIDKSS